ncbi:uncharacterized protein [Diadema antillarum]|uniref:uncharacterized protein n=1 Tax=Diadema antillarum TaxID=105358 RepID=UPI003A8B4B32
MTPAQEVTSYYAFTLSLIALVLTFSTYCIFPSLRTLPGLSVMTVVIALIVVHILMLYVNSSISSVMGFAWVFGYVASFSRVSGLWYVFIFLNSLQGILIFVCFGLSAQVRQLWRRTLRQSSHAKSQSSNVCVLEKL